MKAFGTGICRLGSDSLGWVRVGSDGLGFRRAGTEAIRGHPKARVCSPRLSEPASAGLWLELLGIVRQVGAKLFPPAGGF